MAIRDAESWASPAGRTGADERADLSDTDCDTRAVNGADQSAHVANGLKDPTTAEPLPGQDSLLEQDTLL